jgi:hypothetical protein
MGKEGKYGSNEFINRVTVLLGGKYDKELATLQADSVSLQQIKIQSLILLEVLEELRKFNTVQTQKPVLISDIPKSTNPVFVPPVKATPSASDTQKSV